jgi:hypothetical protein
VHTLLLHSPFKVKYPWNRLLRPIGLGDFEDLTLSRQLAHRWRWGCQHYVPATLYCKNFWYSFLLRGCVNPMAMAQMEIMYIVKVTLWPTVSRPVCFGVLPLLGQVTRCYIYLSDNYFITLYSQCRAPSPISPLNKVIQPKVKIMLVQGKIFNVTIGRAAWEACSATWNLGTNSAFALGPRKTTENLDWVVPSQDLQDANWLLANSSALNPRTLTLVPNLCCCVFLYIYKLKLITDYIYWLHICSPLWTPYTQ